MSIYATGQKSVVIIGSFGKHLREIGAAAKVFESNGYEVLSPPGITNGHIDVMPTRSDDFLVLETDEAVGPKELQDRVIAKMHRASLVYWVNPHGYVGESAAWEFGNANSIVREDGNVVPVYAWHKPENATFALFLQGRIFSPEDLCQRLADQSVDSVVTSAKHLFFDIDDTLVNDQGQLQAAERAADVLIPGFQERFIQVETANIPESGHSYGLDNMSYIASFIETWHMMDPDRIFERQFKRIVSELMARRRGFPEVLPGVDPTLAALQTQNNILHVVSRGTRREQMEKLIAADLHKYFTTFHMVAKKDEQTYRQICRELGIDAAVCCMVGNSMRYDINPALRAGWGAVYVAPPLQWVLEQEETCIEGASRFVAASNIGELVQLFDGKRIV